MGLCNNKFIHENKKYLSLLEQTGWIDFNHQIMKFSIEIVASLKVALITDSLFLLFSIKLKRLNIRKGILF